MLQIHGIFNLVAALYQTRLLQPEFSIWVWSLPFSSHPQKFLSGLRNIIKALATLWKSCYPSVQACPYLLARSHNLIYTQ